MSEASDKVVKEIFLAALEKPAGPERAAYLAQACGQDAPLRERVTALLRVHAQAGDFLETPVPVAPELGAMATTDLTEKPGDKIGHYKLLQQIGEGGCGVVYLAEQEEPIRRRVALKVIKLGMDTRQVVARFEAERQALALMDHPNISRVLDAGTTGTGRPYFVMELVRGIKITDYCDENSLPTRARLDLFVEVCHAIQHAHQKGIIHRDIKPSNILVTLLDGRPVPKVIDFGIAKATGGQVLTDKTLFTAFEQFIGTPAYMSPEQAVLSGQDPDTRSDVYALGVLLYELLTGHTPFEQRELVAAGLDEMRRIIHEKEPVRPSTRLSTLGEAEQTTVARRRQAQPPQLVSLVRGDLDWIVMRCLEKDRSRRYETASGLAEDVSRHLADEPVTARPPGRMYQLNKLVRRNKLVFAAGAVVVSALVIGLGVSTWLFLREQLAHQRAVAAEKMQGQLRAQAQAQATKSEEVARFLKEMLDGVGPSVALGRDTALLKEILDKTAAHVGRDLTNQPEIEAELRSILGNVYLAMEQYTNAEAMHRAALTIRIGLWGNLNTNVADSLEGIGRALLWPGITDQAEPYFKRALSIRTNLLGAEHLEVARSLFNLGRMYAFQISRPAVAESFLRQSLAMRRKLLGNDHVEVAQTLSLLCPVLYMQGRAAEAETVAREALAIQARLPGGEQPWDTETTRGRLVVALYAQQKLDEAELECRQVLDSYRKVLGSERDAVVQTLNMLARICLDKGRAEEAETLAREAIALSKKFRGDQYPTPLCLNTLGLVLMKTAKLAEAESAFREGLACWERTKLVTIDEPGARAVLIDVLRAQSKLTELEAYLRESLAAQRKLTTQAARERETDLLGHYAYLLREQGKLAEAETAYREGVINAARLWPNNFADWEGRLNLLVDVLVRQNKPGEVDKVYDSLCSVARVPRSAIWIAEADAYGRRAKWKEAIDYCSRVIDSEPTNHTAYSRLALVLVFTRDLEGYHKLRRKALDGFAATQEPAACVSMARVCLLLPCSAADLATISNWVQTGLAAAPDGLRPWAERAKGQAEYQAGHFAEALTWARKSMAQPGTPEGDIQSYCLVAMAEHRLNHATEARAALAKATRINRTKLAALDSGHPGESCWQYLRAQVLLHEASALIGPERAPE